MTVWHYTKWVCECVCVWVSAYVWKIIEDTVDALALWAPLGRYVLIEVHLNNNKYNKAAEQQQQEQQQGEFPSNLRLFIKFTVPFCARCRQGKQVRSKLG